MHMVRADIKENIYAQNDHIAEHVREYLSARGVFAVNVMGAPGTGKTTSLEQLMKHLKRNMYVIEGDIESDLDTERLRRQNVEAAQINTSAPVISMRRSCTMPCMRCSFRKAASFLSKMSETWSAPRNFPSASTSVFSS